jgi:chromate transporter
MKTDQPAPIPDQFIYPSLWKILITWFIFGIQSFGGGSATYLLIHQACMKEGWVNENEFVHDWALAQIAPGINLVKLTILITNKLRGGMGVAVGMAGLLLPSALITVGMTAGFNAIRNQPVIQAMMHGVLPATIGLSVAMAVQMAQPLFNHTREEGIPRLFIQSFILVTAALLLAILNLSPVIILVLAGVIGALALAVIPAHPMTKSNRNDS